MRHNTPSEAELAKAELGYPGHYVLDPAMFVAACSSPLQHPASPPCFETPSPSPLSLSDLLTHTTLLKVSKGQGGWSTVYPGAARFLALPAGAGKPKEKGTVDMPNTLVVAPAPRGDIWSLAVAPLGKEVSCSSKTLIVLVWRLG